VVRDMNSKFESVSATFEERRDRAAERVQDGADVLRDLRIAEGEVN
jgi:hypothetical protein